MLEPWLGPVWSNTPLDERHRVPAPAGSHTCLDLGEEEYTKGRPHPMIDPEARLERLRERPAKATSPWSCSTSCSAMAPTPTRPAMLAPACAEVSGPDGPRVVAYVLGTEGTPRASTASAPRSRTPAPSSRRPARRAALAAAAIACRNPRSSTGPCRDGRRRALTYSTKPRGGVVHTLALAEALVRQAAHVEVVALGDPAVGFFRRVDAPLRLVPAPEPRRRWRSG